MNKTLTYQLIMVISLIAAMGILVSIEIKQVGYVRLPVYIVGGLLLIAAIQTFRPTKKTEIKSEIEAPNDQKPVKVITQ